MNVSFFPGASPSPEPERPVTPPWFQPPVDEYPTRLLIREFLAQTDGSSLSLSHVDVYSTGVRIKVDWELRRADEPDADWHMSVGFHGRAWDAETVLRFGLALADGTVVTTIDRYRLHENFGQRPEGWSLMDHASGSGGDDLRYSGASRLWLWPLPPPGPIEFVAEWRARGIPESRLPLDGSAMLAAAHSVRPLWG